MNKSDAVEAVEAFIKAINQQSLADLSSLMTADHTFIDSLGRVVSGREAMLGGWKAYWAAFPDYTIQVDHILAEVGLVGVFGVASGTYKSKRGILAENRITMPAAWKAVVEHGLVKQWQVYADWSEGMKIIEREGNGRDRGV